MLATWYPVAAKNNDIFWRTYGPAKAVGARVAAIPDEQAEQILTQPNTSDSLPWQFRILHPDYKESVIKTELGWKRFNSKKRFVLSLKAEFPLHEGTAMFIRPSVPAAILAASMRTQGIRTVAESDDNYFARQFNLMLRREMDDAQIDMHARSMCSFDACVFSTNRLRDYYYKEFVNRFGKAFVPEMHVAENHIDERDWPDRIERDGPLRVGFMGSDSHVWDINVLYGAFQVAKQLGAETHMIGYNPGKASEGEVLTDTAKHNVEMWSRVVDKHTPWMDSLEFRKHGLPLDIALCPLRADAFTLGKSDIKAVEATIAGAAVVASNLPVFNCHWKHEETCLLANSNIEFAEMVRRLIRDAKLRYELVTNAQEYVLKERGRKQMRHEWREVLIG